MWWRQVTTMRFTVGVFATILDERGRALLCHRNDYDFWSQPGGGLERGETPWQGVVREVKEETGLDVAVTRLVGIYSWPDAEELIFSFRCDVIDGALTLNDEARDLRYFALDDLPANLFAEHVERIRDAVTADGDALLRKPAGPSAPEEIRHRREMMSHRAFES